MIKWGYRKVVSPLATVDRTLIINGEEGWELVSVFPDPKWASDYLVLIFKRPITPS